MYFHIVNMMASTLLRVNRHKFSTCRHSQFKLYKSSNIQCKQTNSSYVVLSERASAASRCDAGLTSSEYEYLAALLVL